MKKLLPIILFCFLSCASCMNRENKTSDYKYIAKGNFGTLEISASKLDSIISFLPYWKLSEYKTIEANKITAAVFLKRELIKSNQDLDKFLILEIIENENQKITFHLSHIDTYVYLYNLERDSDAIPITGNATGVDGWYTVNLETEKLSIAYEH